MKEKYITVPCATCGKGKKLRVDNRTCSKECYAVHLKEGNRIRAHTFYVKHRKKKEPVTSVG